MPNLPTTVEFIRKRPGMYIGPSNQYGIYQMLRLSCDLLLSAQTSSTPQAIEIDVTADLLIEVRASVCPAILAQAKDQVALHTLLEQQPLRFWDCISDLAVIKALSSSCVLAFRTADQTLSASFSEGIANPAAQAPSIDSAFLLRFQPDTQIITDTQDYRPEDACRLLDKMLVLNRAQIQFRDPRLAAPVHLHYPQGVTGMLKQHLAQQTHATKLLITCAMQSADMQLELALAWLDTGELYQWSVIQGWVAYDGGSHIRGALHGFAEALDLYARQQGWRSASAPQLRMAQLPRSLVLYLAINANDVQYRGPTKEFVDDQRLRTAVRRMVREQAPAQFAQYPWLREWLMTVDADGAATGKS